LLDLLIHCVCQAESGNSLGDRFRSKCGSQTAYALRSTLKKQQQQRQQAQLSFSLTSFGFKPTQQRFQENGLNKQKQKQK